MDTKKFHDKMQRIAEDAKAIGVTFDDLMNAADDLEQVSRIHAGQVLVEHIIGLTKIEDDE